MTAYLVTDPDCGFCQRSGQWLEKHFGKGWSNAPATAENLALTGLAQAEAATSVCFVEMQNGEATRRYRGSDAVARAVAARGAGWRLVLIATYPPLKWLAQALYRVIAKNRHRFPGASVSCNTQYVRPSD